MHLIDAFDPKGVTGAPAQQATEPLAVWDFTSAAPGDTLGWKAGPGVADLRLVDGKPVQRKLGTFTRTGGELKQFR